jgi:hypothetical protein
LPIASPRFSLLFLFSVVRPPLPRSARIRSSCYREPCRKSASGIAISRWPLSALEGGGAVHARMNLNF